MKRKKSSAFFLTNKIGSTSQNLLLKSEMRHFFLPFLKNFEISKDLVIRSEEDGKTICQVCQSSGGAYWRVCFERDHVEAVKKRVIENSILPQKNGINLDCRNDTWFWKQI